MSVPAAGGAFSTAGGAFASSAGLEALTAFDKKKVHGIGHGMFFITGAHFQ